MTFPPSGLSCSMPCSNWGWMLQGIGFKGPGGRGFKGNAKSYKELIVWQKAYQLCLEIYKITAIFPKEER